MRSAILTLIFSVACCLPGLAQNPSFGQQQASFPQPSEMNPPVEEPPGPDARMMHEMEKKLAVERDAQLRTDTDKLLKLSEELKAYVDKTNQNILSLDVVRKADEIEKLAKSVKDKMKGPN